MQFPERGAPVDEVLNRMRDFGDADADWRGGRTWSLVFYADDEIVELLRSAYTMYMSENALSPAAFPSLKRFESEVLAFGADLLGDSSAVGAMTSGGTESILLAVKTARDFSKSERGTLEDGNIVIPESAHPAFEKAAHYLGLRTVHVPLDPDFRADVSAAAGLVNDETVLVVGSAPGYPHGVVDPIEELAALAARRRTPFHVDACLGGYMLPWLERLGYSVPPFDFRVPGVTSISADLHKYGYAAKGASTIFYRSREMRKQQFFVYSRWPGGLYASPSLTGTRPGGAIAAAWAVINHLGAEGYMRLAERAMSATKRLIEGINSIKGLEVLGSPDMTVFAFTSSTGGPDILKVGAAMQKLGWGIDRQQKPDAFHLMVVPQHDRVVGEFLDDLAKCASRLYEVGESDASGYGGTRAPQDGAIRKPHAGESSPEEREIRINQTLVDYLDSVTDPVT